MAGILVLSMGPARLGYRGRATFSPTARSIPPHRLDVDRPALAIQQGPDPPVAEPRVRPGQLLNAPSRRRLLIAEDPQFTELGPGRSSARATRRCDTSNWSHNSWAIRRRRGAVMAFFSRPPGACGGQAQASATRSLSRSTSASSSEMRNCSLDMGFSWRAFQR